jgi:hypothetical protein
MKFPVRNLVTIAAPAATAAAARAAGLTRARALDPSAAEDAHGRVSFTTEWEPAFKELKELSAQFPEATFTLHADAFAQSHWLSETVYQAGKATADCTVSRIDGENFRRVYREIFGEAFVAGR